MSRPVAAADQRVVFLARMPAATCSATPMRMCAKGEEAEEIFQSSLVGSGAHGKASQHGFRFKLDNHEGLARWMR